LATPYAEGHWEEAQKELQKLDGNVEICAMIWA